MNEADNITRRLAAILSTDVKGYSRLMGDDEVKTVRTITRYRGFISTLVETYRGRVVDSPGDNLLAEFASAVDALDCAAAIQEILGEENLSLAVHRRMEFRIGINVGDVISQGTRLYGDGVNIAARLEGLSQAGGICISGTVYDQVKNKTDFSFMDMGMQQVKNIADPVRVFRVVMSPEDEPGEGAVTASSGSNEPTFFVGSTVASPLLEIPDKPSIAVLPLVNMSNDPEQDYFSDGLTEDIITDLSKVSGMFVIAKNSTFAYKGKSVPLPQISRELGVRHILEGSVRRAGQRVRVATQLVDGTLNQNVWADRFDGSLEDIFDLQDQVTGQVVSALKVELTNAEQHLLTNRSSVNPEAYDLVKKADKLGLVSTFESHLEARNLYRQALELDPAYAPTHVGLGWTWFDEWPFGWSDDNSVLEKALNYSQAAVDLDQGLPGAYLLMSCTYLWMAKHKDAEKAISRLLDLAPNNADGLAFYGQVLSFAGRPEEALAPIRRAQRMDPRAQPRFSMYLGNALCMLRRYGEAVDELEPHAADYPSYVPLHITLTHAYSGSGNMEKAAERVAHLMALNPDFSRDRLSWRLPYKDSKARQRTVDALKAAGLP